MHTLSNCLIGTYGKSKLKRYKNYNASLRDFLNRRTEIRLITKIKLYAQCKLPFLKTTPSPHSIPKPPTNNQEIDQLEANVQGANGSNSKVFYSTVNWSKVELCTQE